METRLPLDTVREIANLSLPYVDASSPPLSPNEVRVLEDLSSAHTNDREFIVGPDQTWMRTAMLYLVKIGFATRVNENTWAITETGRRFFHRPTPL
jgi:hypothetical protein